MIDNLRRFLSRPKAGGEPKIFVIGFNKCGTKTLHEFFLRNRIRSAHCNYELEPDAGRTKIATTMRDNLEAGKPILDGMTDFQAFSDLVTLTNTEVIEANCYFREMHQAYPDAFFIFNDRPLEDWIKSRLNHEGGPGGSFVRRYASASGISQDEVPDLWRNQYTTHKQAVLEHFQGYDRFAHFDLMNDGPEKLQSLFGSVIAVNLRRWEKRGSRAERVRQHGIPTK